LRVAYTCLQDDERSAAGSYSVIVQADLLYDTQIDAFGIDEFPEEN